MPGDRDATMAWFRTYGGILVSIRCLDEGLISLRSRMLRSSSSQNPRQFIQRRGRVLRRTEGKELAVIHDAIVVPVSARDEPEQMSLLQAELIRSVSPQSCHQSRGRSETERLQSAWASTQMYSDADSEKDDDGQ